MLILWYLAHHIPMAYQRNTAGECHGRGAVSEDRVCNTKKEKTYEKRRTMEDPMIIVLFRYNQSLFLLLKIVN
jgi:hypothetical protein